MPKIAFLFPGQGAQVVGMGRELDRDVPAAHALFDRAGEVLGFDLRKLCFEGPPEALEATDVSQPAIFVASLAALEALRASEPATPGECVAAAGLSLGEYTALTWAGALSFEAGLQLVQRRGEAMQAAADASAGTMVSVLGLEQPRVEELVAQAANKGLVRLANLLGPGNLVVSGEKSACAELERLATEAGARTVPLTVAGAFQDSSQAPATIGTCRQAGRRAGCR